MVLIVFYSLFQILSFIVELPYSVQILQFTFSIKALTYSMQHVQQRTHSAHCSETGDNTLERRLCLLWDHGIIVVVSVVKPARIRRIGA